MAGAFVAADFHRVRGRHRGERAMSGRPRTRLEIGGFHLRDGHYLNTVIFSRATIVNAITIANNTSLTRLAT